MNAKPPTDHTKGAEDSTQLDKGEVVPVKQLVPEPFCGSSAVTDLSVSVLQAFRHGQGFLTSFPVVPSASCLSLGQHQSYQ